MSYDELLKKLLAVCPRGSMGRDNDGQLVFYTDLCSDDKQKVEDFDPYDMP